MMRNYRKKHLQPMRPYEPGEDLTGVSVALEDNPAAGGMIAVDPNDPNDQWYVSEAFFKENYELVESADVSVTKENYRISTLKRARVEIAQILESGEVIPESSGALRELLNQIEIAIGEE